MAKVGLKDTLALIAKGYSKKEIDALAAIDEEQEQQDPEVPAPVITDSVPAAAAPEEEKDPEPDYKSMYEDLLKQNKEKEAKITKLQQDNIHKDSAPAAEEARKQQMDSLQDLVRGFM